jgi:hypothetical protein
MEQQKICRNCAHWRDKAWTNKGWGVCDNPQNEVKVSASAIVEQMIPAEEDWAKREILDSIRYPEDFGCIFFAPAEPIEPINFTEQA